MNKAMCLVLCLAVSGCAWFKANEGALTTDGLNLINCVVTNAQAGQTVEQTSATCGNLAYTDTVAVLDASHVVPVPSPGLTLARTLKKQVK